MYFASGVALSKYAEVGIASISASVVLILISAISFRRASAFILPLIFLPLGAACFYIQTHTLPEDRIRRIYDEGRIASGEPVEVEGILLGMPESAFGGLFLTVQADSISFKADVRTVTGRVRLFAPVYDDVAADDYDALETRYGSRIRVMCNLKREEEFRNPGVKSRVEMLDEQSIDATATVKSPLLIEKIRDEPVFPAWAWTFEQRQRLINAFREHLSAQTAGVMIASLLGDKHFLDKQTADVFRDGGTFHVLVISGLHITFIGGLSVWLVSFFTRSRRWQFLIAASFLWVYTFGVGAEIPVVRASLMFSVLLFSRLVHRTGSLLNALGTCGLILLVWRPSDLFTASFQLTFVSVGAIVGCSVPLVEKLRTIGRWVPTSSQPLPPTCSKTLRRFCELLYWNQAEWQIEQRRHVWSANLFKSPYLGWLRAPNLKATIAYFFEGLLVSLIVQICMLPLLVYYFHRVSPVSVLLNLWVGVLLALESFAAVSAVFVNLVSGWLAAPLFGLTEFFNSAILSIPSRLSELELAGVRLPVYSGAVRWIYPLFVIIIGVISAKVFRWNPFLSRQRWRAAMVGAVSLLLLAFVILVHPFSSPAPDGRLRIDFLDVGQGDSALVTFPDGETMLVDGGGRARFSDEDEHTFEPDVPSIGESVVSEFLWERGYSRIDYLVATHADADHMEGLADVARNFEIGVAFVGATPFDDPEFARLFDVLQRRSIPMRLLSRGDEFWIGETNIQILNPSSNASSSNNGSIVMRLVLGDQAFLLTGDIEREIESELTSQTNDLTATLVKVPHHGSRTSSTDEFVAKTRADIAVISVGRRSRFGHPHREVVERWRESGASVLTTGESGTITAISDGRRLEIRTFVP